MQCPFEVAEIVARILQRGLVRIRALGWQHDAARCAIEADHLHNLPTLLTDYKPVLLDYYWRAERQGYIEKSTPEDIALFQPLWDELAVHIDAAAGQAAPAR